VDPEVRRALLTFVIVGGGPTGVECSGAISELIRLVLSKDYPRLHLDDIRVILMEATQTLLPGMPDRLRQYTLRTLKEKHVEVQFQAAVDGYDGEVIQLKGGESLPARTLIWAAGVRAAELVDTIDVEHGRLGRMVVEQTLQIPGHPEVFAIGDAAYLEDETGRQLPMVAPVAMQQADVAVENIRRSLARQPLRDFEYHDPGSLATIGRSAAVANLGRWQFTGFAAWVVWLVVHIMQLVGFRNRLFVFINWVWDYLFYDRAVRLIEPFKRFRTTPEEVQIVADDEKL
jgi:NADH dehydrogenase